MSRKRRGSGPVGYRETSHEAERRRDAARAEEHVRKHGDYAQRREEHLAMLREALAALEAPAGMRAWIEACALKSASTDNYYSAKNAALLAWQAPGATYVAGLKEWRKVGVRLVKGTGSIRVTGPGGRVFHVYDVSQTHAADDPNYSCPMVEDAARVEALESLAARELEAPVEVLALAAAIVAAREGIAAPDAVPTGEATALAAHKLAPALEEHAARAPAAPVEAPAPAVEEAPPAFDLDFDLGY